MRPAPSIIFFTTIAGAAQGMTVVLAVGTLAGITPGAALPPMLWTATAMLLVALASSFFHLGHPLRAWRAVLMWRTSWMSREVIVLPLFIALVGTWALFATLTQASSTPRLLAVLVILGALLLWYCTAMIYACIRFIQEWAHPLTIFNYVALGLASGLVTSGAFAALAGETAFAQAVAPWAVAGTALAWFTRALALRRNAQLRPKSSTQSATGLHSPRVVQTSMGMTAGSFNTREFFHGAPAQVFQAAKIGFQVFAFALPILLLALAARSGLEALWAIALTSQAAGLLAERWFFFAQARHPQNIYYQAVS